MQKELITALEYGAAQNGAVIYLLPELNCILLEWKGDVLLEEWIDILTRGIEEIQTRKITNWIGDTTNLGATSDEHDKWVQDVWLPSVSEAGLKKLVVVLSNDILGEMTMMELMDNVKNKASDTDSNLQSIYTKDFNQAIEWIKSA
jgi:hypothetical protein